MCQDHWANKSKTAFSAKCSQITSQWEANFSIPILMHQMLWWLSSQHVTTKTAAVIPNMKRCILHTNIQLHFMCKQKSFRHRPRWIKMRKKWEFNTTKFLWNPRSSPLCSINAHSPTEDTRLTQAGVRCQASCRRKLLKPILLNTKPTNVHACSES